MKITPLFAVALFVAAPAAAKTYEIDAAHSSVTFKVRHLVSKVRGRFDKVAGTIDYDPAKVAASAVNAEIDPATINTGNANRDNHLKTPDFFDVQKCPALSFKSTKVTEKTLTGDLTMHCVTKPVTLELELGGLGKDPWGNEKLGASARGKLNRKDWGIVWNKTLDAGGAMLGDDVDLEIEIEANAKGDKTGAKEEKKAASDKPAKKK